MPPIMPHEPTLTSTQKAAPSPNLTAASAAPQASDSDSDSDSSLAYKLIDTTELCEQILSYLSCTELCRAKRVCQRFRAVIDSSLILQRHLFLEPCAGTLPEGSVKTNDPWHNLYDLHPLLTLTFKRPATQTRISKSESGRCTPTTRLTVSAAIFLT